MFSGCCDLSVTVGGGPEVINADRGLQAICSCSNRCCQWELTGSSWTQQRQEAHNGPHTLLHTHAHTIHTATVTQAHSSSTIMCEQWQFFHTEKYISFPRQAAWLFFLPASAFCFIFSHTHTHTGTNTPINVRRVREVTQLRAVSGDSRSLRRADSDLI